MTDKGRRDADALRHQADVDRRKDDDYRNMDYKLRQDHLEQRFRRFFARAMIGFVALGLSCAIALLGFGYLLREQEDRSMEIQDQRRLTILQSCEDQNERRINAEKKLKELILKAPPSEKLRAQRSRAGTIELIEAIVPLQDCEARVKKYVGDKK